jgi:hypothetical protein
MPQPTHSRCGKAWRWGGPGVRSWCHQARGAVSRGYLAADGVVGRTLNGQEDVRRVSNEAELMGSYMWCVVCNADGDVPANNGIVRAHPCARKYSTSSAEDCWLGQGYFGYPWSCVLGRRPHAYIVPCMVSAIEGPIVVGPTVVHPGNAQPAALLALLHADVPAGGPSHCASDKSPGLYRMRRDPARSVALLAWMCRLPNSAQQIVLSIRMPELTT